MVDLRGKADRGQFAMQREDQRRQPIRNAGVTRGEVVEVTQPEMPDLGQRWAVITGLVPLKQQKQAFAEAFEDTLGQNPQQDIVEYMGFFVQRAEVESTSGASNELTWKDLPPSTTLVRASEEKWSGTAQEVVDPRFVHQRLTFPLGPLRGRLWGEDVAHTPEIPLFVAGEEVVEEETSAAEAAGETPFDAFDVPDRGEMGGRRTPTAPRRRQTPARRGGEMMEPGMERVYGGRPGMAGSYGEQDLEYLLFRCFDYTVEPGKKYRYRVKLVLRNPNYGMSERFLRSEDLGKSKWIANEQWSEPTDVIEVPRDTSLLAVGVNPPIRLTAEPSAKMLLVKWVEKYGVMAHKETSPSFNRGKVLNWPECKFPETAETPRSAARTPTTNNRRRPRRGEEMMEFPEMMMPGEMEMPGRNNTTEVSNAIDVDYMTEALALDMRGGDRLPGRSRLVRPGTILLLDPEGFLVVHNELDDLDECEQLTKEPEPTTGMGEPGMRRGVAPEGGLFEFE